VVGFVVLRKSKFLYNLIMKKNVFKISDKDIFPNKDFAADQWQERKTVKIILLNTKGEMAMIGNNVHKYFTLPGGGVDDGEDIIDAVKRECKEETRYSCKNIKFLTESFENRGRDKKKYNTFCYLAEVGDETGEDLRTDDEKEKGIKVKWMKPKEALNIFERQEDDVKSGLVEYYNTAFNIVRDLYFLRTFLESKDS
jgi:ADP-ribose pyrophosphatase YjhB (NUDIX family)